MTDNPNVADTPADPRSDDSTDTEESIATAAREYGVDAEELISEDEATVPREPDGSLRAEPVFVDKLGGKIITEGIEPAEHERIVKPFLMDASKKDITDGELADLFDAHLVYPDLTNQPACPNDRVTAEFVADHLSDDQQVGYLIGMCKVGRQYESARRLRGEIPEHEQDLALRALNDPDFDVSDVEGNRRQDRTRR